MQGRERNGPVFSAKDERFNFDGVAVVLEGVHIQSLCAVIEKTLEKTRVVGWPTLRAHWSEAEPISEL